MTTRNEKLLIAIFSTINRTLTPQMLSDIASANIYLVESNNFIVSRNAMAFNTDPPIAVKFIYEILTRVPVLLETPATNMPANMASLNGVKIFDFAVYEMRGDLVEHLLKYKGFISKISPSMFHHPVNIGLNRRGQMSSVPSLFHLVVKTYLKNGAFINRFKKMYKAIMKVTPDGVFKLAMHNHGWDGNDKQIPLEILLQPLFDRFGKWENLDSEDEEEGEDPDDMLSDIAEIYDDLYDLLSGDLFLDYLHYTGDTPSRVVVDRIRDLYNQLSAIENEIDNLVNTSQLITEFFKSEMGSYFGDLDDVDPYWTENDVINMSNITNNFITKSPENLQETPDVLKWFERYEFQYSNSLGRWVHPLNPMPIELGANMFKYKIQNGTQLPYRYWWQGRDDPLMFYEQDTPVSRHDIVRLLDPVSGYETWEIIDFKSVEGQDQPYRQYMPMGIPVHIRRRENSIYQNEKRDKPYNIFLVRGKRRTDVSVVTQYLYVSNYEIEFVEAGNFLSDINDVTQWDFWSGRNHYWDNDMRIWRSNRSLFESDDEQETDDDGDIDDINNTRYIDDSDYEWSSDEDQWVDRSELAEYEKDENGEWRWVPIQHIIGSDRNVEFWQDENYGWDDETNMWFEIHDDILGSAENRRYHHDRGRHWDAEQESWVEDEDGDDENEYDRVSEGEDQEELSHDRLLELAGYERNTGLTSQMYYDSGGEIRTGDHVLVNNYVVGIVMKPEINDRVLVLYDGGISTTDKSTLKFIYRMAIYTRRGAIFTSDDKWFNISMRAVKIGDIVERHMTGAGRPRRKIVKAIYDTEVACAFVEEPDATVFLRAEDLFLIEKSKRKSRDGMNPVALFPDKSLITYGALKAANTRQSRPVRKHDIITAILNNETKVLLIDFVEYFSRNGVITPQLLCSETVGEIANVEEDFILNADRSLQITYRGHSIDKRDMNGTDISIESMSLKYPGGRYIRRNDVVCYSKNRAAFGEDITNMIFKIRTIGSTNLEDFEIASTDPVNNLSPGPLIYIQEIKREDYRTGMAAGRVIATTKNRLRWLTSRIGNMTSLYPIPSIARLGRDDAANNPLNRPTIVAPPPPSTAPVSRRLEFSEIGMPLRVYIESRIQSRKLFYFEQEKSPPFEIVETETDIIIGDRVEHRYKQDDYAWTVVGLAHKNHQADDDKYEHVTNKEYVVPPTEGSNKYRLPSMRDKRGAVIVIKNEKDEYRRVIAFDIMKYMVRALLGLDYSLESFRKVRLPNAKNSLTLKIPDEEIYCDVGDSSSSKFQPVIVSESTKGEYSKQGDIWFVFCAKELQAYLNSREGHHGFTWNARDDDSNLFNEGRLHYSNPFTKNEIRFVKFMDQKMIDLHLQNLAKKKKEQKPLQEKRPVQIKQLTDKEVEDFKKRIAKLKEELKTLKEGKGSDKAIKEVKDEIFRLEQPLSQSEFAKAEDNYKEIVTNNMIMMMQKQRDSARRRLDEAEKANNQREIIAAKQSIEQFTKMIESQIAAEMKRREAQNKRPREDDDESKEEDTVASRVRQRRRNELYLNFIKLKI